VIYYLETGEKKRIQKESAVMPRKAPQTLTYRVECYCGVCVVGYRWCGAGMDVFWAASRNWAKRTLVAKPETTENSGWSNNYRYCWQHGITLTHPTENAALNQQEALLLANQREPDASNAKKVVANTR